MTKKLFILLFFALTKVGYSQSLNVTVNTTLTAAQFLSNTNYTIQPGVTLTVTGAVAMNTAGFNISVTDNGTLAFGSSVTSGNSGNLSVTGTGSMSIGGSLTLNSSGSVTDGVVTAITGNITVANSGAFTMSSTVTVTGSVTQNSSGGIVDNGYLNITGNYNIQNSGGITGTGSVTVGGTASSTSSGTFFGSATGCSGCTFSSSILPATTYTAIASASWGTGSTWNPTGPPTATSNVLIPNGFTVNVTANQSVNNVTMSGTGGINFTSAKTLTVGGALNLSGTPSITGTSTGTLTATTFTVAATATASIGILKMTISGASEIDGSLSLSNATGTKTLSGGLTMTNGSNITYGAAATLVVGTSLTCNGTNTITYSTAGTFSTSAVTINGTTTIDGTATGITNFTSTTGVSAAAVLNIGNTALTTTGAVTVGGNLNFTNASGTKTLGNVSINAGGTWNASAVDQTYNFAAANLTNNGTFNAGATTATVYSFTGASQINGTLAIPSITISSGTTTNNATLTVSNQLGGGGTFTQGGTGYLYYAASASIAVSTFVATAASNTVDYTFAGAQTVKKATYYNLTISTSGTKTLAGATVVSNNLTVSGTAQLDVSASNNALSVGGNWTLSSTNASPFLAQSGTVTFNGTSGTQALSTTTAQENFYGLTINNTSGSATGVSLDKNTNITGVFTLTSGTLSIGSYTLNCTGTTAANAGGISGSGMVLCTGGVVTFGTTAAGPTVVPTVSITTLSITMQRGTYTGPVYVTKSSASSVTDSWRGGNTYNGTFTLINAAVGDTVDPSGDIYMGSNSVDPTDVFNANSYFYVTGSSRVRVAASGSATFNAPAHFYSQGFGPSNAANGHDRIQPARFSPAVIIFNDSAIFYCSSATTDMYIAYDPGTTATFNKPVVATHGGSSQANFYFGGGGTVNLNDDIYFNNTGSGTINIINQAGGIATLANTKRLMVGSKGFISGSLTAWNLTQVGTTAQSLTFTGTAILNIGGNGTPCTFNAPVSFTSPNINLTENTFNGTTNIFTMSGTTNQNCYGGNTYANGSTNTFVNSSTGYWRLGVTRGDTCYGDAIFKRASTGQLSPAYANTNYYYGNISIAAGSDSVDFCTGTGIANIAGTTSASFINNGNKGTSMKRIVLNKTGGASFTLNNNLGIPSGGSLTLTSGLMNTSASGYLFLMSQSVTAPALTSASTSYINGPMRYDVISNATQTLNFPIGKGADCRPVVLTVRHSTAATSYSYLGQLFNADPWAAFNSGSPYVPTNMPGTVDTISGVHYWTIDRTVTSSGAAASNTNLSFSAGAYPLIQLGFGTNDGVYQGSNLTIVKNTAAAPAAWIDIGATCALGNFAAPQAGSIVSTTSGTPFNSFSSFTLGSKNAGWNPLPIELLSFSAIPNGNKVDVKWETVTETNNAFFTIEKSKDGKTFTKLVDVPGAGNSTSYREYAETDYQPYEGTSYYRLKQTDINGVFKYFTIVPVTFTKEGQQSIVLFPNPMRENVSELNVKVMGYQSQEVLVVLRNVEGKEFLSKVLLSEDDGHVFILDDTKSLLAGSYIVTASSNDKIYNYKLIVK